MAIISLVILGISAGIAYIVGVERVGREYDTNRRQLHSKAAAAKAKANAA